MSDRAQGSLWVKRVVVLLSILVGTAGTAAHAGLITSEDFESGATGWKNNTTTYADGFTTFLGRFGGHGLTNTKTYTLSGHQTEVTIAFDFYEIDSWDRSDDDAFMFYINGIEMFYHVFQHTYYDDFCLDPNVTNIFGDGETNIAFNVWSDQAYHFEYTVLFSGTSLTLGFGATISQGVADESYGIDNVMITDNYPPSSVPEPATLLLFGLGATGFLAARKKNRAEGR